MDWLIIFTAKYLLFIIGAVALGYWVALPRGQKIRLAAVTIVAAVIGAVLTKLAGSLHYDPRPFVTHNVHPLLSHAPDNGFPSDHTVAATVAALAVYTSSRRLGLVLLALAIAVGAARVAAHVHSPQDIAAAVAIGVVSVLAAKLASDWFWRRRTARRTAQSS